MGIEGLRAVKLVEVDPVGLEPPQRRLAGRDEVAVGVAHRVRVRVVHPVVALGREDDPVAPGSENPSQDRLARPAPVYVGGVEEVDAEVERRVEDRTGLRLVAPPVGFRPKGHGPQARDGDLDAGAPERTVLHPQGVPARSIPDRPCAQGMEPLATRVFAVSRFSTTHVGKPVVE